MASVKPSRRALLSSGAQQKLVPSFSKMGRLLSAWVSIRPVGSMYTQLISTIPVKMDASSTRQHFSAALPNNFRFIIAEVPFVFAHYTIGVRKIPACFPQYGRGGLNNSVKDEASLDGIFADFYLTIVFRADTIRLDVRLLNNAVIANQ